MSIRLWLKRGYPRLKDGLLPRTTSISDSRGPQPCRLLTVLTPSSLVASSSYVCDFMVVSWHRGTPKSSRLMGFFPYKTIHFGDPPWLWKPPPFDTCLHGCCAAVPAAPCTRSPPSPWSLSCWRLPQSGGGYWFYHSILTTVRESLQWLNIESTLIIFYKLTCMYVCMHAFMYVCMHACMYVCMHVCMHACMHACMYVCIWMPQCLSFKYSPPPYLRKLTIL